MSEINLQEMAKTFGVDAHSLESLTRYLVREISNNSELKALFNQNPSLVIQAGTKKWLESSNSFLQEVLDGKKERAIQFRNDIAEETWKRARQAKNLPIE